MSICVLSEQHYKSVAEKIIKTNDSDLLSLMAFENDKKTKKELVENYVDTLVKLNILCYETRYEEEVGEMDSWKSVQARQLNKTGLLKALDAIEYQIEDYYLPELSLYENFVLHSLEKIINHLSKNINRNGKRYMECEWEISF